MKVIPLVLATVATATACSKESPSAEAPTASKMIVLGVDGMDPEFLQELLALAEMPRTKRLIDLGGFRVLETSNPPQSPVAWSNFITGLNPGGHGLFDFLTLDRKTLRPYLPSSTVVPADIEPLELENWRIPLKSDQTLKTIS